MDYLACVTCGMVFSYANAAIKSEASNRWRNGMNRLRLYQHAWNLIVFSLGLFNIIVRQGLFHKNLPTYSTKTPSFIDFFRLVAAHDFLVKFITMVLKITILLLPRRLMACKDRGNVFRLIERTSQFYRHFTPLPLSFVQCLFLSQWRSRLMGVVWRVLFYEQNGRFRLLRKGAKRWLLALNCLRERKKVFGKPAGDDDLVRVGEACPICFDNFQAPIVLECSHIFCESCIHKWFEKEHLCPMCRTRLPGLAWTDGSTLGDVVYR